MHEAYAARPVVLVVEDDSLVRMLAVDLLEEAGFEVVEAEHAPAALDALARRPDVQVMLTDVEMPGQPDGFGLARRVAAERPEVGIMIVSGRAWPRPGDLPPGGVFVGKPYDGEALVAQVYELARTHH
jgi:two-component system, response regulator PdtaR